MIDSLVILAKSAWVKAEPVMIFSLRNSELTAFYRFLSGIHESTDIATAAGFVAAADTVTLVSRAVPKVIPVIATVNHNLPDFSSLKCTF
nr:hypothetical protein [Schleiferilactobacillus harbinensis]